jgi:hypothetical protein
MFFGQQQPKTPRDAILHHLREGYPVEIAAAAGDMLPEELAAARAVDSVFDRQCKIAENFGKKTLWDNVASTATGAVRAFQRQELGTWANSAEPVPEKSIEDYLD